MKTTTRFAPLALALLVTAPAFAAVPDVVTYAGVLRQGAAPADGTFSAVFEIFDAATAGTRLFTQAEPTLAVSGGELVVDLGSDPTNPLDDDLLAGGPLFLSITVNGEELSPRVQFTSVPYARRAAVAERAEDADTVDGINASQLLAQSAAQLTAGAGLVKSGNQFALAVNGVSGANIADSSVTGADIADSSIGTADIASGAVTSAKIATSAVTSTQILDGTVNTADVRDGAITSTQLLDGTILAADLHDGAVTSAKILDGNVTNADLGPSSVTTDKIATGAVHTSDIGDAQVTAAKIDGVSVLQAPRACGGQLMLAVPNTVVKCETIPCAVHRNNYSTNNEDIADTFFQCNGSCGVTDPTTCDVTTVVGLLVAP